MVVTMLWQKPAIYLVLAVVTTLQVDRGKVSGSEAAVRSRAAAGSGRLGSVKGEPGTRTRHGSLRFRRDGHGVQTLSRVLNAKLKRLDPSVQCSDTAMTLKVKGRRTPHFLVDSGEGPLIPFSQMPSSCGFSVKRSRRDVTLMAPYQGCHVAQQAGSYALPLHLSGIPMMMSCPTVSPLPSVTCYKSRMVLKISGVAANEVRVKVSGTWMPLSSVCRSCGITTETVSGEMTLVAPYNRGPCVTTENEEYLLYLRMGDIELWVKCPSTVTSPPSRDAGQVAQYPQAPGLPHWPVIPGAAGTTHSPLPTTVEPSQKLQLLSDLDNTEGKPFSKFPYMPPQLPQLPQYPGQYSADAASALLAQLYMMQQLPQYSYQLPVLPQFPMVPGLFHPTAPPPPTTATLAPTVKHDGIPQHPQQLQQFPVFPHQYSFMPFGGPLPPGQARSSHMLGPHHPQMFQLPALPNPKYLPQQSSETVALPAATTPTSAPLASKHDPQLPPFNPYLYMPHYMPQQAFVPKFPAKPGPPEQHGQQSDYHPPFQYYPFGYQQSPKLIARGG
ncbi:uncharacterized protein [Takifugu rubripes]|uniref:uncharacterized protein n=1 Tax=Takifugu rubripes TaxID=31033 RepID=UPI0005D17D76|nr:uncharacterized protein LOC101069549 [Takifugu rubripes]|eukprot:XP_011612153.1 PREDICTED: uncharacterized protein LOC101069549 [Takifugu rubripes]